VRTPDEYYRSAAECLQLAQTASDNQTKAKLLEMAQRWIELADHAERTGDDEQGRLMSKSEEYQQSAAECLHLSRAVNDSDSRATLVEIAETWMKLARHEQANAERDVLKFLRG